MPVQVIEGGDPLADLVRFRISPIHELIVSLRTLLNPKQHLAWATDARETLGEGFMQELQAVYAPYSDGLMLFEVALSYPDYTDIPGFIDHVRAMPTAEFLSYFLGRMFTAEEIGATNLGEASLRALIESSAQYEDYMCMQLPWDWSEDAVAFHMRVVNLWQRYWEAYFHACVAGLQPRWVQGLHDKQMFHAREGGQRLFERVTGRDKLPPELPENFGYTEIVFVPMALMNRQVLMFYGYGNITILFDCNMTEDRRTAIELARAEALSTLKGLGDDTRLKILNLIAKDEGHYSGKLLASRLGLSASAVSRHLTQLKEGRLIVEATEDNRTITYRLHKETITALPEKLLDYLFNY